MQFNTLTTVGRIYKEKIFGILSYLKNNKLTDFISKRFFSLFIYLLKVSLTKKHGAKYLK